MCKKYMRPKQERLNCGDYNAGTARCFRLFQVAFSLPIAFSTSLEGSVIEMKPTTPVSQDTVIQM